MPVLMLPIAIWCALSGHQKEGRMPRTYERMCKLTILVPAEQCTRLLALGVHLPKPHWMNREPEITRNMALGIRRAIALAEPYMDAATRGYTAECNERVAKRRAWLEGSEERARRSEQRRERAERNEERDRPFRAKRSTE
jgi:hypothetical protein